MIDPNKDKRISLKDVIEHDYFNGEIMEEQDRKDYMSKIRE